VYKQEARVTERTGEDSPYNDDKSVVQGWQFEAKDGSVMRSNSATSDQNRNEKITERLNKFNSGDKTEKTISLAGPQKERMRSSQAKRMFQGLPMLEYMFEQASSNPSTTIALSRSPIKSDNERQLIQKPIIKVSSIKRMTSQDEILFNENLEVQPAQFTNGFIRAQSSQGLLPQAEQARRNSYIINTNKTSERAQNASHLGNYTDSSKLTTKNIGSQYKGLNA